MITHLATAYLGRIGVYTLAALMGVTDVDPFILGMTASAGTAGPHVMAAASILIAAAGNNLSRGFTPSPLRTGPRGARAWPHLSS